MFRGRKKLENVLREMKGISTDKEIFPDPEKSKGISRYTKEFRSNSTFVITTHFLKSLLTPVILALPAGFRSGGLIFSVFGFFFMLAVVGYNTRRVIESATYLSSRERIVIRTYDEVAYVSFSTCSQKTKRFAGFFKVLINVLFIITYLDACSIFMIFMARNVEALINFHFPENSFTVYHYLFLQVIWMMLMSSIRDLKYLTPFSFISCLMLLVVVFLTVFFFLLKDMPETKDRIKIGTFHTISQFTAIVSFSLSGMPIALTLKSSMLYPKHFFGFPGVFCFGLTVMSITFVPFGFLGYLKYGNDTAASIMLNLPLDETLAIAVKITAIFSTFFASPLVFYVAFNVLWSNYLRKYVNPINVLSAEYFGRYCFIVLSFIAAVCLPDLGTMIVLKGALLHSHLEITIPAIINYVTYYPAKGNGRLCFYLIQTVLIILFGVALCVSGSASAIMDFVKLKNNSTNPF